MKKVFFILVCMFAVISFVLLTQEEERPNTRPFEGEWKCEKIEGMDADYYFSDSIGVKITNKEIVITDYKNNKEAKINYQSLSNKTAYIEQECTEGNFPNKIYHKWKEEVCKFKSGFWQILFGNNGMIDMEQVHSYSKNEMVLGIRGFGEEFVDAFGEGYYELHLYRGN